MDLFWTWSWRSRRATRYAAAVRFGCCSTAANHAGSCASSSASVLMVLVGRMSCNSLALAASPFHNVSVFAFGRAPGEESGKHREGTRGLGRAPPSFDGVPLPHQVLVDLGETECHQGEQRPRLREPLAPLLLLASGSTVAGAAGAGVRLPGVHVRRAQASAALYHQTPSIAGARSLSITRPPSGSAIANCRRYRGGFSNHVWQTFVRSKCPARAQRWSRWSRWSMTSDAVCRSCYRMKSPG